jgi:hypothetical protein
VRRLWRLFALLAGLWLTAVSAAAHEVRPAYLQIDQTGPADYAVLWKQPTMGDVAIHLVPHLSNGWLEAPTADAYVADGFMIRRWQIHAAGGTPGSALDGKTVSVEGLSDTITDVFVRIRLKDGHDLEAVLRPEAPAYLIQPQARAPSAALAFVWLGVQHILSGPDHLLFVLGLLLIVRDRAMLLKTVSAFTVAHSLTLAAATFGLVHMSTPLLNALIALSILFVAPEAIRARRGGTSLTIRHPWVVAFAFGLLHGLGFANGLVTMGLDETGLVRALVAFNVGVEVGQLLFIGLVVALIRALRLMAVPWPKGAALAPGYLIGGLGAMWTLQYAAVVFGAG